MKTLNFVSSLPRTGKPRLPLPEDGLHGVLNVNKPFGWTSHDVVKHLRGVLGIQKIGHAGTLDPAATGVLPILVGKSTKIAEYLLDWDKEYLAVMRLGQRTDTEDAMGNVIQEVPIGDLSEPQIRSTIAGFQVIIRQVPPMFSAVKVGGQPLYKLAHKGKTIERKSRVVKVECLEVLGIRGSEVELRVVCSKGTYVRTLCSDIGEQLKVGAHLQSLKRRRVGTLHIDDAVDLKDVSRETVGFHDSRGWKSLDDVLNGFRSIHVDSQYAAKVIHGNSIPWSAVKPTSNPVASSPRLEEILRVKDDGGRLLAIGEVRPSDEGTRTMGWSVSMIKVLVDNQ